MESIKKIPLITIDALLVVRFLDYNPFCLASNYYKQPCWISVLQIKGSWAQRHGEVVRNPYTTNNCCGNFTKILCGPSYTSLLRLREDKNKEKRDMEEVKKKIEKLMFDQQNNSSNQVFLLSVYVLFSVELRTACYQGVKLTHPYLTIAWYDFWMHLTFRHWHLPP